MKHLDGVYKTHRNKNTYPRTLTDAIELHRQKYKDDGRKKKEKEKKNNDNSNELPTNNGATGQDEESGNNSSKNNESTPTGDSISAHLNNGEDNKFKELLLLVAHNNDGGFDMTETEDYLLASEYSKESLAGAHFGGFADEESEITLEVTGAEPLIIPEDQLSSEEEENLPDHIKFTINDL